MHIEIAIAKYALIFSMPVKVVVVLEAAPGVLGISERVGEVVVKQIPLRLYILLQVKILGGGKVSKEGVVQV